MKYNRLPLISLGITGSWEEHKNRGSRGQDFGWSSKYGGQNNTVVYAINDGTVINISCSTGTGNAGNTVWIRHSYNNEYDLLSRYCHLKDNSIVVKNGEKVTRGQKIAIMGGTYGYAVHLHYEMWKVPKNWSFAWSTANRTKYAVKATDYTFAFDDQVVSSGSENSCITKIVGTSSIVKRDTSKNQIEVIGEKLRARKGAGTNQTVLGYIDFGIYNYTETKTANNYTWYKIKDNLWIAGTKEDTKVYLKEEQQPTPSIDDTETLKKEIETLKETISIQDKQILDLKKELEDISSKENAYLVFEAKNNAKYYIDMKQGEKLYKRV